MLQAIRIGRHGVVAPNVVITPRWPLLGQCWGTAVAFRFDGDRLVLHHVGRLLGTRASARSS